MYNFVHIVFFLHITDLLNMEDSICIPKHECPCTDASGKMVVPPGSHVTVDCQEW